MFSRYRPSFRGALAFSVCGDVLDGLFGTDCQPLGSETIWKTIGGRFSGLPMQSKRASSQMASYFGRSFSARQPRTSAVNIEPSGASAIWWGSK